MKNVFLIIGFAVFTLTGTAQQTKTPGPKKTAVASATPAKKPASTSKKPTPKKDEKAELEKAMAMENAEQKAAALAKFLSDFPKTESRPQVLESLAAARIAASEAKFEAGDSSAALKLANQAIDEAPLPYPEKLFNESIAKLPMMLYTRGETGRAHEVASLIEKNAAASATQLLALANFYLGTENGAEAKRLAEAAIKIDEKSAAAYQALGMANRLNFDLEGSAAAYEKAVAIEPESVSARQSLAEMKRALGKPDEAIAIFSALIEKDSGDVRSVNGRILSLFDAGKRTEAEAEFAKAFEADPTNIVLLAGAAYWYAANGANAKAIDIAGKAIAAEPRYIWSHIALARGLASDGRYQDAEQVLLKAKQYGNFSTLDYEIATVRYAGGFFREASEELQKSFSVKDGMVTTKLGRRIDRSEKGFTELLGYERRASILEPKAADKSESAEKLKSLLELKTILSEKSPDEAKAAEAASAFAAGDDKMRFHRQIYAANELLERSIAPSKALELSKAAVAAVDEGLAVPDPAGPIMASELYDSRTSAIAAGKYVLLPDVPKQTLSTIARGRIEQIAGRALLQQKNNAEAATRLRRAISILPEKSTWWRTSLWRLGNALEADGKDKEALDAYVKSYTSGEAEADKYAVIEAVYKRMNNGVDGLEALVGANPAKPAEKTAETETPAAAETKAEVSEAAKKEVPQVKTEVPEEKKAEPPSEKKTEPVVEKLPEPVPSAETGKVVPKEFPAPSPSPVEKQESRVEKISLEPEVKKQADEPPVEPKPSPVEMPSPKPIVTPEKPLEEKLPEAKSTPKPLFEPVVIAVKSDKSSKPDDAKASGEPLPKAEAPGDQSGASRPRVVVDKSIVGDEPACTLTVSQNNVSLIGGGGSVGLLVGSNGGDIKEIKSTSSSPQDIEVIAEPENAGITGRVLFVIRSLTSKTGTYQVTFSLPCGKKEVAVRVR